MQLKKTDKSVNNMELDSEELLIKTILDTCRLIYPEAYYIGKGANHKKAIVARKKLGDISEPSDVYIIDNGKVMEFHDVINFRNRNSNFIFISTDEYGKDILEIYNRYTLKRVYSSGIIKDKSCVQLGKKLLYYFLNDRYNNMAIQLNNETGELNCVSHDRNKINEQ